MIIVTLGIAVLLAEILYFPWMTFFTLADFDFLRSFDRRVWLFFMAYGDYAFSLIVAVVFVFNTRLRNGLPKSFPGKTLLLIGLILVIMAEMARLLLFVAADADIPTYGAMYALLLKYPGVLLIFLGLIKVLLASRKETGSGSSP
ncbi:MAG: hypothetical protein LBS70_10630 [Candidatus Accumulibacter sp.]|jgi:hypothetical protein|nr:hypothetical protein [Accumulibacter sp.]